MDISILIGKTLTDITNTGEEIRFFTSIGEEFRLFHEQDCCEHVRVEDIAGDIQDLIGNPIIKASEDTNRDDPNNQHESVTWTFYNIATIKGYVTIRWCGESNGYYSESVDFEKVK